MPPAHSSCPLECLLFLCVRLDLPFFLCARRACPGFPKGDSYVIICRNVRKNRCCRSTDAGGQKAVIQKAVPEEIYREVFMDTENIGQQQSRRRRPSGNGRKRRRGGKKQLPIIIIIILLAAFAVIGTAAAIVRYAPSKETMPLSSYFAATAADQAAVIVNGAYDDNQDGTEIQSVVSGGAAYLEIGYLDSTFDRGWFFDATEGVLRYVTDTQVISANLDSSAYTVGRDSADLGRPVVISSDKLYFVAIDFVKQYTDLSYTLFSDPARLVIETPGYEKSVSTAKKDTEIRRFGGPKSKILAEIAKGEGFSVLENYGKWSKVLTDSGVIGCMKNSCMGNVTSETTAATLPERNYSHLLQDTPVCLLWHQVMNTSANAGVSDVIAKSPGVNVLSPTWFTVADTAGGLRSIASLDYVRTAHASGIKVWALVGNVENADVDMTALLGATSSRDNLVNNIIGSAIAYSVDGINIDFESLQASCEGGYREFIRELSLRCKANGLVLSVDNYVPSDYTAFYDRANQADYADYVVIMAYDEHHAGAAEAGPNASISFVKDAVTNTMKEVPANQTILGMPFFTRVWAVNGSDVSSKVLSMAATPQYMSDHSLTSTWSETDGVNYAEYKDGDTTYKVWLEDAKSLSLKLSAMKDSSLAGGAFWKSGQDSSDIWATINSYMN